MTNNAEHNNSLSTSSLHEYVRSRNIDQVKKLIYSGTNIDEPDDQGFTPLHWAANVGAIEDLLAVDTHTWTMLHTAAFHGRLTCFQMLLRWGLRFEDGDKDGNTPAHLAGMEGHLSILQCIAKSSPTPCCIIDMPNDHGETVESLARRYFKKDVVSYTEKLRQGGQTVQQGEIEYKKTAYPAHSAAYKGDLSGLRLLIEEGVVQVNDLDEQGSTPLHKATGQGHAEVVQWLLEKGAQPETPNYLGDTPVDVAKRFGQLGVLKLLTSSWRVRQRMKETTAVDRDFSVHPPVGYVEGETQAEITEDKIVAQARAKEKVRKYQKLLQVARCDYKQLGGEVSDDDSTKTEKMVLEAERKVEELTVKLDYERMRREKLEAQLHLSQQEINQLYAQLNCQPEELPLDEGCVLHRKKVKPHGKRTQGSRSRKSTADDD